MLRLILSIDSGQNEPLNVYNDCGLICSGGSIHKYQVGGSDAYMQKNQESKIIFNLMWIKKKKKLGEYNKMLKRPTFVKTGESQIYGLRLLVFWQHIDSGSLYIAETCQCYSIRMILTSAAKAWTNTIHIGRSQESARVWYWNKIVSNPAILRGLWI